MPVATVRPCDTTTTLWNKGSRYTVTVEGRALTECAPGRPASSIYRGHGTATRPRPITRMLMPLPSRRADGPQRAVART